MRVVGYSTNAPTPWGRGYVLVEAPDGLRKLPLTAILGALLA